jgi:hypothetical protein
MHAVRTRSHLDHPTRPENITAQRYRNEHE